MLMASLNKWASGQQIFLVQRGVRQFNMFYYRASSISTRCPKEKGVRKKGRDSLSCAFGWRPKKLGFVIFSGADLGEENRRRKLRRPPRSSALPENADKRQYWTRKVTLAWKCSNLNLFPYKTGLFTIISIKNFLVRS